MATFWEIATRSVGHMLSLSFVYFFYFLFISHFGLKSRIWLMIASVPDHCFSITLMAVNQGVNNCESSVVVQKSNRKAMNRNCINQRANSALKNKTGNK